MGLSLQIVQVVSYDNNEIRHKKDHMRIINFTKFGCFIVW